MPDLVQKVSWPGVVGVESCYGTISHGVTPATFVLTTFPQTAAPRQFGTLVLGDGVRTVALLDCKLDRITGSLGTGGQSYQLEIQDRRWRWRSPLAAFGSISGRYNRADARGKLVPWTIRSPMELAELCLAALGETNAIIDLPRGLSRSVGRDLNRYLRLGENFRQSLANPEQFWDCTPPAEALSRLCDYFGRRVVFQPQKNRIVIARLGVGDQLPEDEPYEMYTPALTGNTPPSRVVVAGAPVRVQARFRLEAVGEEWDGSYLPINDLSYAPLGTGQKQITTVTFAGGEVRPLGLRVDWTTPDGEAHFAVVFAGSAAPTIADRWAELLALMAAQPFGQVAAATVSGNVLTLTGLQDGQVFEVAVTGSAGGGGGPEDVPYAVGLVQEARLPGPDWSACPPPTFTAVRPTDRLSYGEALTLARKSVFRYYRILAVDPATYLPPLVLPWFGKVARRQQIVLQPSKVEQVSPVPRVRGGDTKGNPAPGGALGQGILPEFYNGFSRDREATCTGAVQILVGTVVWNVRTETVFGVTIPLQPNTRETDRVYVPFETDPLEQTIKFTDYVYRIKPLSDGYLLIDPADLVLETGCLVSDAETDQLVRWKESLTLGGTGLAEEMIREDLQVGVVGKYTPIHTIEKYTLLDAADTKRRAEYYLRGMAAKWRTTGGDTRQYVGIYPFDLDGAIQQVSWEIGPGGPSTIVSRNSEHSPAIPPYPARRKQENLSPNQSAAAANMAERAALERLLPPGRPGR